jgi:hypothetical protein
MVTATIGRTTPPLEAGVSGRLLRESSCESQARAALHKYPGEIGEAGDTETDVIAELRSACVDGPGDETHIVRVRLTSTDRTMVSSAPSAPALNTMSRSEYGPPMRRHRGTCSHTDRRMRTLRGKGRTRREERHTHTHTAGGGRALAAPQHAQLLQQKLAELAARHHDTLVDRVASGE